MYMYGMRSGSVCCARALISAKLTANSARHSTIIANVVQDVATTIATGATLLLHV